MGNPKLVTGYQGKALQTTGRDCLVYEIGDNFSAEQGTIECLFKLPQELPHDRCYLLVLYLNSKRNVIRISSDDVNIIFTGITNKGHSVGVSKRKFDLVEDKWIHFALTWEPKGKVSVIRIYVNGQ